MIKITLKTLFFGILALLLLWFVYGYLYSSWASVASVTETGRTAWQSRASWYGYSALASVFVYTAIALYIFRKKLLGYKR